VKEIKINNILAYKLRCVEFIVMCTKPMASNRISFLWVIVFFLCVFISCARATSLVPPGASGHASK